MIKQIATLPEDDKTRASVLALMYDGTILVSYRCDGTYGDWESLPPIPNEQHGLLQEALVKLEASEPKPINLIKRIKATLK